MDTKKNSPEMKSNVARVTLINAKRANGPIGIKAKPLKKDEAAWIAKGWKPENAAQSAK